MIPRRVRQILVVPLAIAAILIIYFSVLSFMATRPNALGVTHGQLAPCPSSPNCVSTQANDADHQIAPLKFTGSATAAWERLKSILASQPRMKIVTETDHYLHVEATSRLFRFVDDVEFALDEKSGTIEFRSASRVGYSDLGANRARMERIRTLWE